jgi:hypothetical protein
VTSCSAKSGKVNTVNRDGVRARRFKRGEVRTFRRCQGDSQFQPVSDAFSVMPAPPQVGATRGRMDVSDEQLTISGVPTGGTRRDPRSRRTLRPALVPLADEKDVTPDSSGQSADSPNSAVDSRVTGSRVLGVQDVNDLGVRTDLVTACRIALGIGSTTAYALAGRGQLPFPAYRVGRQWVVPTAGLRAFLGLP